MKSFFVISAVLVLVWGCTDAGSDPPTSATIQGVFPDSAAVGDTILITGIAFGAVQGSSVVTVGGATVSIVVEWSDTRLIVGVPSGAASGALDVSVAGQSGNSRSFRVQSTPEARVSYSGQLENLLTSRCISCHGGTNNLTVTPHSSLMQGTSDHGPVVSPYDGEGSVIIRKLRGTAGFGSRMPQNGPPFLTNAEIELVARWIKQGARNN